MAVAAAVELKMAKELQQKFTEKGAISSETAMTLEELGLEKKSTVFELLLLRKHIIETGDKYYFDNEKFDDRAVKKLHNFIAGLFTESEE
jgi:hypothetical protein